MAPLSPRFPDPRITRGRSQGGTMSTDPTQPPEGGAPPPAPPAPPPVTIHEAELASGASGGVIRGAEIDFSTAVARRRAGKNVVVCGDDLKANRRQAEQVEA